jgi:hypothetical protein
MEGHRHEKPFSRFSQFCESDYKRSCSVRTSHTMQRNTRIILRNTKSLLNYYKKIKVNEPAISAFNTAIERACMPIYAKMLKILANRYC